MCAVQVVNDLVDALFSGCTSDFRLRTRAETFGNARAELDDAIRLRHGQCLRIGVGNNEVDTLQTGRDHVVDSVTAATADAENGDTGL
jgi:hypothetical protein